MKIFLISILVVAIISTGAYLLFYKRLSPDILFDQQENDGQLQSSQPISTEVVGQVLSISGSTIRARVVFQISNMTQQYNHKDAKNIQIIVTPETKFIKTVHHLPTKIGAFDYKSLQQEVVTGSFADLGNLNGASFTAKAADNILGQPKFIAQEIAYTMDVTGN